MAAATPTISVGLPVFNGENYVADAIESVLAQTFTDFELIICDNASTDRTEEIGRKYAEADPRVRYHRNERNIGGARNQALAADLSRGRYIRLIAHDDLMAPTSLEACLAVLEARPDAVIAFSATSVIDEEGAVVSGYHSTRGTAATPSERFAELVFRDHNCDAIYGLMRADVVHATPPLGNFIDADKVWLSRLAMQGPFVSIPESLFYKRFHPKNHVANWRDRMAWFNPDAKGKPSFPNWVELSSFVNAVATARISGRERLRCARTTLAWTVRYAPNLAKDLAVGTVTFWRWLRKQTRPGIYNWE